jgi:hypothetical protein
LFVRQLMSLVGPLCKLESLVRWLCQPAEAAASTTRCEPTERWFKGATLWRRAIFLTPLPPWHVSQADGGCASCGTYAGPSPSGFTPGPIGGITGHA